MKLNKETKSELLFITRWVLVSSIIGLILFAGLNCVSGGMKLTELETIIVGLISVLLGGIIEWHLAEWRQKK